LKTFYLQGSDFLFGKSFYFISFIFLIIIILPLILIKGFFFFNGNEADESPLIVNVYNHRENKIISMELSAYLKGVLAAEMPAVYNIEALKAQAVTARTYTLKHIDKLSTDYHYSQAWYSEEDMKGKWGFILFFYYWSRISNAVEGTKGEILVYNGELIDAVYHANSGGLTEDAKNVWGKEVPYLKSVPSIYDIEKENNYESIIYFSPDELDSKLGIKLKEYYNLKLEESNLIMSLKKINDERIFELLNTTKSGRVLKIRIGDAIFTGSELREKLNLPSNLFNFSLEEERIVCKVLGKGHGVGMSQDGAEGYANHGYDYRDILEHYYQGTSLANKNNFK
jgi:stage II sporulation protein D